MKTQHRPFSYEAAKCRAIANAKYFNQPYMVFTDTCGNWRCEPDNERATHDKEIVLPPKEYGTIAAADGTPVI